MWTLSTTVVSEEADSWTWVDPDRGKLDSAWHIVVAQSIFIE